MAYHTVDFENYTICIDTNDEKLELRNKKGLFSSIFDVLKFRNPFRVMRNLMEHYYLSSYNLMNTLYGFTEAFGMPSLRPVNPFVKIILRNIADKAGYSYDRSWNEYKLAANLVEFLEKKQEHASVKMETSQAISSYQQTKTIHSPSTGPVQESTRKAEADTCKAATEAAVRKAADEEAARKAAAEFENPRSPYYLGFPVELIDTGRYKYKKIKDFVVLFIDNGFVAFQRYEVPNTLAVIREAATAVNFKLRGGSAGQGARDLIKTYGNGDKSCARVGDWFILLNENKKVEVYCSLNLRALHVAVYAWRAKKYNPAWTTWEVVEPEITKLVEAAIKEYNTSVERHKKNKNVKIVPIPCPYFKGDDGSLTAYAPLCEFKNADFEDIWESRFRKNNVKNMLWLISKAKNFGSLPEWSPIYWGEQLVKTYGDGLHLPFGPFICVSNANEEPVQSNERSIKLYYDYVEGPMYAFASLVGFPYDLSWDDDTFMRNLTNYLKELK